jgi:hypothetical protein
MENTKVSGIHLAIYYVFLRHILFSQLGRKSTLLVKRKNN